MAIYSEAQKAERWVQVGMRAAIRDMQDVVDRFSYQFEGAPDRVLDVRPLQAYLMTMLVTAGGHGDDGDGQS